MLSGRMSFKPCATPGGTQLAPFRIHLPDAVIGDLQTRSRATCRPETETADEWSQHEPLARLELFDRAARRTVLGHQ